MDVQAVIDALSDIESLADDSEWDESEEELGESSGEDQESDQSESDGIEEPSPSPSPSGRSTTASRGKGGTARSATASRGKGPRKGKGSETEYLWDEVSTVKSPTAIPYQLTPGPNLAQDCDFETPQDYFTSFFSEEVFELIVKETNVYANLLRDKQQPLAPRSRLANWKDVDVAEMKAFIGLILNMGMIRVPTLQDYWSTDITTHIPFFSQVMSRDRFLQILSCLHLSHQPPPAGQPMGDLKIRPLLNVLAPAFESNYTLGQKISIDESMIPFKGRLKYKQYIPNKPHAWGIKAYVLADSQSGYMYRFRLYFGSQTELIDTPGYGKTEQAVLTLMDGLLGRGHHLFTDRFYTSVPLLDKLGAENTSLTGTIVRRRRLFPSAVRSGSVKLQKGETKAFTHGNNVCLAWRDKRNVFMATNAHGTDMVTLPSKVPGKPDRRKPKMIEDYNHAMGGVDKADQMGIYYCFQRKSIKWWKKVFFWLLEISVVNSYILYKETTPTRPHTHLAFRHLLVKNLVCHLDFSERPRPGRRRVRDSLERLQAGKHFLSTGNRRDCVVCSDRSRGGERHLTNYYCSTCSDKPPLHPTQCFEEYHTLKTLKRPRQN